MTGIALMRINPVWEIRMPVTTGKGEIQPSEKGWGQTSRPFCPRIRLHSSPANEDGKVTNAPVLLAMETARGERVRLGPSAVKSD